MNPCDPLEGFFRALWLAIKAHGTPCRYAFIRADILGRVTVTGEITMVQLSVDLQAAALTVTAVPEPRP